MEGIKKAWGQLVAPAKATIICFILGQVISITSESSVSSNGVITSCSFFDFGAVLFGAAGVIAGGLVFRDAREPLHPPKFNHPVGAIGVFLGLLNLAQGFGMVGGPCPPGT